MGSVDSKGQISPPETPVYLKYSHLKELQDPRSPLPLGQRTPVTGAGDGFMDPRSPSAVVPRTPIFCIPEPEENEGQPQVSEDSKQTQEYPETAIKSEPKEDEPKEEDHVEVEVKNDVPQVESSPEKMANQVEFSDKGYLIKNKPEVAKKKRRRRKNKKVNQENKELLLKKEKSFNIGNVPPRSPLASRNFIPRRDQESPSLEFLVKNTRKLSLNSMQRSIKFQDIENIGQENMAATFSP